MHIDDFISRWESSQASERANKDSYLKELCRVLGVPEPNGKTGDAEKDTYVFEADARILSEQEKPRFGRMDLYRKGCFVLEAKQGSEKGSKKTGTAKRGTPGWASSMTDALGQALQYARTLDEPPPFVIVVDIGFCFDIYASFDGSGAYRAFPNAQKNRLRHKDLRDHADTLRAIWLDPQSLDPSRHAKRVTRQIAEELAELANNLEGAGHQHELVSRFLMRCVFTMFAEDTGLLPDRVFSKYIESVWIKDPASFKPGAEALWRAMNAGENFYVLGRLLRFNGGLFADPVALELDQAQLRILKNASAHDWCEVEPAIFGTLIERALNPSERHRLGAHFTPTEYVRRLLVPALEEPLREAWNAVRVCVRGLVPPGEVAKSTNLKSAVELVKEFQRELCSTTILDPACGSGNFLYVALHLMKEIESEVRSVLDDLGVKQQLMQQEEISVTPKQFIGIEVRPGSKEVAELVLWIGYLQWHHRMYGGAKRPPEPILRDYKNIVCRDAVLDWQGAPHRKARLDRHGRKVTRWDGETTRRDSRTGRLVPDETAAIVYEYPMPSAVSWPRADYIIGNPPFVGNKRMRLVLGDEYVAAIRGVRSEVPESADYVAYWWSEAARLLQAGAVRRFGLITTNSITQTTNRPVVQAALDAGCRIAYALPDHPWIDSSDGAQVRVAMTVLDQQPGVGTHWVVETEVATDGELPRLTFAVAHGAIQADLSIGTNTALLRELQSNGGLACPGVQLSSQGFVVSSEDLKSFGASTRRRLLRRYITGRDLTQRMREQYVLDTYGLSHDELRDRYPDAYQWLYDRVKPEREGKRGDTKDSQEYAKNWWLFAKTRSKFRGALVGLSRFIVTSRTARHRTFQFIEPSFLPETKALIFAFDDAFFLGVLSSRIHVVFANRLGGWLGVGNDATYNHSDCFEKFPFPVVSSASKERIRKIAERLDVHRRRQCMEHSRVTMTSMYNVLEKIRGGEELSEKEKELHEQGRISVLLSLHADLDAAVFDAYGWPSTLTDEQILGRLIALNVERAEAEDAGSIHWLRSDYQETGASRQASPLPKNTPSNAQLDIAWPSELPDQVAAVRDTLLLAGGMLTANDVAAAYEGASAKAVVPALRTLEALGIAVCHKNGSVRWKALAKATGERVGPIGKAS